MQAKVIFICSSQKKVVSLPSKVQRRGLEGGRCPLSESQMLTQRPQSRLSRHIKKAFITLCSDWQKSRKFRNKESGLSNDRCPRDVYIPYARTSLGYACVYISAWASRCRFYSLRQCESLWQWNDNSRTPRFFICLLT